MEKILIISNSPLHTDPRVLVQIDALKGSYELTCIGHTNPNVAGVDYIPMFSRSLIHKVLRRGKRLLRKLALKLRCYSWAVFLSDQHWETISNVQQSKQSFDLILCNDLDMIAAATSLKNKLQTKLYLDAHEYSPRQHDSDPNFAKTDQEYWDYIMQTYQNKADFMTTVCQSLAEKYAQEYGWKVDEVVMNLPAANPDITPSVTVPKQIRLVHHGAINPNRRLEAMIELVDKLDARFTLDFYLTGVGTSYYKQLQARAASCTRIRFCKPVPTADLPKVLNEYDLGIFLLSPKSTNYRYALPNKLFEFIQARLGIVIWPSVEMAKIVRQYNLGLVSEEFDVAEIAKLLNSLEVEQIDSWKQASHLCAQQLHSERSKSIICKGIQHCLAASST